MDQQQQNLGTSHAIRASRRLAWALMVLTSALPAASGAQEPPAAPPTAEAPPAAAPSPAAPAPAAATPAPAPAAQPGDAQYDAKLRSLEEKVVTIKERIFTTKTKLLLIKERLLDNVIAESRTVLVHRNEMGSFFSLKEVIYFLDGKRIYYQDNNNGLLDQRKEFEIYNGTVIPGNHALSVEMTYVGNSELFSYLKGYKFKLKSAYTFYAARGRVTEVSVVGYERGGLGTDLEDKPYIKYEVKQVQNRRESDKAGSDKAGGEEK